MRPLSRFHLPYPDVRAVRIALAAGAVAGLVVIAACTDDVGKSLTAPPSPRNAQIQTGDLTYAARVLVCVGSDAPPGIYKFTNSYLRRHNSGIGGTGTTVPFHPDFNRFWAPNYDFYVGDVHNSGHLPDLPKTSDAVIDPAGNVQVVTVAGTSGGSAPSWNATVSGFTTDGVGGLTWQNVGPAEYAVSPQGSANPADDSNCVTVLTRTVADDTYCNVLVTPHEGPGCGLAGAAQLDAFSVMVVASTTPPAGVTYKSTDCILDQGVTLPRDGSRTGGGYPPGGIGKENNLITNPCNTNNNPTTVYVNIEHGMKLVFHFGPATTSSCPDGSISAGFNGTAVAAGRTLWFNANLKPSGPIVDGTTISFNSSVINLNGTDLPGPLPSGVVTYSSGVSTATTTFAGNTWTTTVPLSWGNHDVFLTGAQYLLPAILAGGADVIWTGAFSSNTVGVTAKWQFSAAAYNGFNADYSLLGVKPIPSNTLAPPWFNSDKGGTPENYKNNVVGGAMGGGGGNFIGSYSATKAVCVE